MSIDHDLSNEERERLRSFESVIILKGVKLGDVVGEREIGALNQLLGDIFDSIPSPKSFNILFKNGHAFCDSPIIQIVEFTDDAGNKKNILKE